MQLTSVFAQSSEHTAEVPPMVIGLVAFAILATLLVGVLMFGKGRPHS